MNVRKLFLFGIFCLLPILLFPQNSPVRVLVIGAHPDDCDEGAGGLAALYAEAGCAVKFVSMTNGDKGHQSISGGVLASRRMEEAREAGCRLGIEYEVLDNHDGELMPTLENRFTVIRLIREWKADIVITHRTNDYHPDHRYTGILVQDAAYMVAVPNILSGTPALHDNPVFLYMSDHFQRPNPFRPDIVVDITPVLEKKFRALDAHVSQVYEWLPWIGHYEKEVPADPDRRFTWLMKRYAPFYTVTDSQKPALEKWYGRDRLSGIKYTEAFEICEYGSQPDEQQIRRLFPMFSQVKK